MLLLHGCMCVNGECQKRLQISLANFEMWNLIHPLSNYHLLLPAALNKKKTVDWIDHSKYENMFITSKKISNPKIA